MKTIDTHPDLWNPTEEYVRQVNEMITRDLINRMSRARRAYYYPNSPLVEDGDKITDEMYDLLEDVLRRKQPDHPLLTMVGWTEAE